MAKINYLKHIYEGWLVQDFIDALQPTADFIMEGRSHEQPFKTK